MSLPLPLPLPFTLDAWKQLMCFTHSGGLSSLTKLRPVLHRCMLQRYRMSHFVSNFNAYLMFEVLESAWNTLRSKMSSAKCLDEVVTAHDLYLAEIEDRALLTTQHEHLQSQIKEILQSVLRYCNLQETLLSDALSAMARRRSQESTVDVSSRRSGGSSRGSFSWETPNVSAVLTEAPDSVDGVPGITSRLIVIMIRLLKASNSFS